MRPRRPLDPTRTGAPAAAPVLVALLTLLGVIPVATTACGGPDEQQPAFNLERMIRQRSYKAYEATDLFPDGTVMRPPPEGTVPRERLLGPPELVDGAADGAPVKTIPIELSMETLETGRRRFRVLCAACHGPSGDGHSPVAEVMSVRKPPSLHEARIRALPDGTIYRVIRDGYGMMPPYGGDLTVEQRWAVVAYVRALQLSRRAPVDELPAALRDELQVAVSARAGADGRADHEEREEATP